jgi:hypothetical protein
MNERIKELAEQASKEAFPLVSMAWMETFAELIVRKCASIVEEDDGDSGPMLKHFGVK